MKIALVCPYDLSKPGGVQKIIIELHKRLIEKRIDSKVISTTPDKKVDLEKAYYFGTQLPLNANQSSTGIDLEGLKSHAELKNFIEKEKFDIICIHEPASPFLNWEVLVHSKTINIGWFHSTTVWDLNSFPLNIFLFPVEIWLLNKLDGLIVASDSARHTWIDIFKHRDNLLLPAGVDYKYFHNARRIDLGEGFHILFAGRLDQRKGVLDAIKSFNLVHKKLKAKLWIVGEGMQEDEALKLSEDLNIKDKVFFLGRIPYQELASYYRSVDCYISPAFAGESVGLVLLEAMAAGTPLIAYANKGYKLTLKNTPWRGMLVKPKSYRNLAESILTLAKDEKLRTKITKWEDREVKDFDWDSVTKKFLNYINNFQLKFQEK